MVFNFSVSDIKIVIYKIWVSAYPIHNIESAAIGGVS